MKLREMNGLISQHRFQFTGRPGTAGWHRPHCQRRCSPPTERVNGRSFDVKDEKHTLREEIILWFFLAAVSGMSVLSFWLLWKKVQGL